MEVFLKFTRNEIPDVAGFGQSCCNLMFLALGGGGGRYMYHFVASENLLTQEKSFIKQNNF